MHSMQNQTSDWMKIAAAVMAFFIFLNIVSFVWFPFLPWFEQRDAGQEVVESQMDAQNAIQEYEWFRTQYHEIQEQRNKIENAYEEEEQFHETYGDDPDDWSRQAETRHGRIHERITGNKQQLEGLVSDYNARSDMAHKEVFKCHLPYKVDDRFAIQGPPGSDAPDEPADEDVNGTVVEAEPPAPEQCDGLPDKVSS